MVASLDVDQTTTMGECETHDINSRHNGNVVKYADVPINALDKSRIELNKTLRSKKQLPSPIGLYRDYRGLCELMGLNKFTLSGDDWITKLFEEWSETKEQESNVATFLNYLELIDRYDIYDDTITLIKEDCCKYVDTINAVAAGRERELPTKIPLTKEDCYSLRNFDDLAQYDVMLLYNEEAGRDRAVAADIFQIFESNGFLVCNMNRSFISSRLFEYAQFENVIKRCKNVFVLISEAIRNNTLLTHLASYSKATSLGSSDQKIVPILLQKMSGEEFDGPITSIMHSFSMKYYLHEYEETMDQFWEQLILSVDPYHPIAEPPARLRPQLPCSAGRLSPSIRRTSPVMLPVADNPPAYYSGACHPAASSTNQPPAEPMQAGTSRDNHPVSIPIGNQPDDQKTKRDDKTSEKKSGNFTNKAIKIAKKIVKPRKKTSKQEKEAV
uniref:TIR domain-containing protein n=1 Tax=Cacopsylla melanoneura TaxID=428564 RepID=A0A8D8WZK2_9HEMI